MVASRSESDAANFDIFHCLRCDTIIRFDCGSSADLGERGTADPGEPKA
jgi:hypothetical protein